MRPRRSISGAALLGAVHAEAGAFQATQIWLGVYDRMFGGEVVEDPVMTSPVRLDV